MAAPNLSLVSDVARFLDVAWSDLRGAVLDAENRTYRADALVADRAAWEAAADVEGGEWSGPGVHPGRLVGTLQRLLPPNAVITTDAGNFGGWVARGYRFLRPGTFLGPTSGAMGYGLPAAIAASLVHSDRPVVAVCGDGGFAMTMAELETSVREGARPVVIVLDNQGYGTIRMHQDRAGRPRVATDLGPIDFAAVAVACGALGYRVTERRGVRAGAPGGARGTPDRGHPLPARSIVGVGRRASLNRRPTVRGSHPRPVGDPERPKAVRWG